MIRILTVIWICLALSLANAVAAKTAGKSKTDSQPAAQAPVEAMVVVDGKPLFPIKVSLYSFSPADRAGTISDRLMKLVKDPFFKVDSIKAVNGDTTTDIVAADKVLMTVTEADATASGKTRPELAREYTQLLKSTIEAQAKEYSARSIAIGAAYAVAATIALIILFILLNRLLPRFLSLMESWKGRYIRSLRLQSIELLHQDRIVAIIAITARTVRLILLLLLLNFYVTLLMSFFPWTREYSSKYLDYILNPLKNVGSAIFSYLPKIFFIIVICVITHFVIKFTRFIFSAVENRTITIRGFYPDWAGPTFNIVRFLIIMVALVAAFPYLPGSESPAFKGISVFLGVLISLGSSSAISNIIAGVIITYTRAFKLGDRIQIGETTGDVVESNLLVTRIRTIKNVDITVPNSMVLGSHVINFSSSAQESGLILHTTVTIGYDAPWRQVHELLIAAALSSENMLELPAPFVLQTSLDDFYVSYQINAYTDKPSIMARTYSELHQNIQEKFNEAGVEIMSPHFNQLRDGSKTTIPEEYLSADYRASAIRVRSVDQ
jgi:small-conductance mechanosensitive channel